MCRVIVCLNKNMSKDEVMMVLKNDSATVVKIEGKNAIGVFKNFKPSK